MKFNTFKLMRYKWYRRLQDAKWWVKHRIHPMHRYHVIKPRELTPGYYDPDVQILHAAFEPFIQFMESHAFQAIDWNHDQETFKIQEKMLDLYNWWVYIRPQQEEQIDHLFSTGRGNEGLRLEEQLGKDENQALCTLASIRHVLWYP